MAFAIKPYSTHFIFPSFFHFFIVKAEELLRVMYAKGRRKMGAGERLYNGKILRDLIQYVFIAFVNI